MFQSTRRNSVQTKLKIGQPNDRFEQEADQVADQVMRMPAAQIPTIQRKCEACEEEELQMKPIETAITPIIQKHEEEEEMLQMKGFGNDKTLQSTVESSLQQSKGSGQNIDVATQSFMSRGIGADFSNVKIHTDSNAIQMNRQLNAKAFTNGSDIYFNQGQYNPKSSEGKHLLAHELTHVVQQTGNYQRNLIQKQDKEPDAISLRIKFPIKELGIKKDTDQEELKIFYTKFYYSLGTRAEAVKKSKERRWFGSWQITDEDWTRGYMIIEHELSGQQFIEKTENETEVSEPRLPSGERKGRGERREKYDKMPQVVKNKINKEANKRYWERTGIAKGVKIKKSEEAKEEVWLDIMDEIMLEKKTLENLPEKIKDLLFSKDGSPLEPKDYHQLIKIAKDLDKFSDEDIAVYKMLSVRASDDLELFSKSIKMFLERKAELAEAFKKYQEQKKDTDVTSMSDAIEAEWQGFDSSKIGSLKESDQYTLARQKTSEITKAQLEHMMTHPGETAVDFAKTATLMNTGDTFKGIGDDIVEAANGDANSWARWAGGTGAGAKLSGWLLAVGGVLYVASWLTGVGELATIAAFMGAMLASTIVLSSAESELRIKAASQAKTPEEFKTQVTKAATARTNVIVMVALLALALAIRFVAKTYFPNAVKKVNATLVKFRERLRNAVVMPKLKAEFVVEMKGHRKQIVESGEVAKKDTSTKADNLDRISLDEFIAKLEEGSGDFFQEASVQDGQKIPWKELSKTKEGRNAIKSYKEQLSKTLRNDVPKEIDFMVKEQTDKIDQVIAEVKKATTPKEMEKTIVEHEKFLSEEEFAKRGKERETQVRQEKMKEAIEEIEKEVKRVEEDKRIDKLDEHDLIKLTDDEKTAIFERDRDRGIYRGTKVRLKDKSKDLELDRVDTENNVITEDKKAKGFERNPDPDKAILDWAEKQILDKTKNKIEFIKNADHTYIDPKSDGSPFAPTVEQVKVIRTFRFRLRVPEGFMDGKLKLAIDKQIKALQEIYTDWKFEVVYEE